MLTHTAEFRPLWPIVFFLPWLALGLASLFWSMRRPHASVSRSTR